MAGLYGEDDDQEDDQKPQWDDDIDMGDIIMSDDEPAESSKQTKKKKKKKKKGKGDDANLLDDGVDVDAMDADAEPAFGDAEEEAWDGTEEMRKRKLDEYMDELYGLDFNDMVNSLYLSSRPLTHFCIPGRRYAYAVQIHHRRTPKLRSYTRGDPHGHRLGAKSVRAREKVRTVQAARSVGLYEKRSTQGPQSQDHRPNGLARWRRGCDAARGKQGREAGCEEEGKEGTYEGQGGECGGGRGTGAGASVSGQKAQSRNPGSGGCTREGERGQETTEAAEEERRGRRGMNQRCYVIHYRLHLREGAFGAGNTVDTDTSV